MGLSNSFVSLGRIVGPIMAGIIFDINPNFPYLAGALILCLVFAMSLVWVKDGQPALENSQAIRGNP
jgi:DHA1 family multidrug resistance protein-like MFS transporter